MKRFLGFAAASLALVTSSPGNAANSPSSSISTRASFTNSETPVPIASITPSADPQAAQTSPAPTSGSETPMPGSSASPMGSSMSAWDYGVDFIRLRAYLTEIVQTSKITYREVRTDEEIECGVINGPDGKAKLNDYHKLTIHGPEKGIRLLAYQGMMAAITIHKLGPTWDISTEGFNNADKGLIIFQIGKYFPGNDTYKMTMNSDKSVFVPYRDALIMNENIGRQCAEHFADFENQLNAPENITTRRELKNDSWNRALYNLNLLSASVA